MPPMIRHDARRCQFYLAEGCHLYLALTQVKSDNIVYVKSAQSLELEIIAVAYYISRFGSPKIGILLAQNHAG
jgi:hypothetical protein